MEDDDSNRQPTSSKQRQAKKWGCGNKLARKSESGKFSHFFVNARRFVGHFAAIGRLCRATIQFHQEQPRGIHSLCRYSLRGFAISCSERKLNVVEISGIYLSDPIAPEKAVMNRYRNAPGMRGPSKASPTTQCQKCLQRDM